jgi:hypothetical protein
MKWTGLVARIGDSHNAFKLLVGDSEKKSPLGRPSHRYEDNIKMSIEETIHEAVDWIYVTRGR